MTKKNPTDHLVAAPNAIEREYAVYVPESTARHETTIRDLAQIHVEAMLGVSGEIRELKGNDGETFIFRSIKVKRPTALSKGRLVRVVARWSRNLAEVTQHMADLEREREISIEERLAELNGRQRQ